MDLITQVADDAAAADGTDPLDEATRLTLRHRPETVRSWTRADGFALVVGTELSLVVAPSGRGQGTGGDLLTEALAATPLPLSAWSHGDHPAAAALARRTGFDRVRELWVMRRATGLPLPEVVVPHGIELRSYEQADAAELLRVNAAAFTHHPEQGAMDAANLRERMAEPWFDPAGLLVATDGTRMLGFHWTKQHSPELGEVYVVGIDPAAQGRGLGKLLTLAGLHHLADAGVDEILLYVESDNAPATATYSGLGFTHADADTHVMYRKD
ncbi:mycothiol synthase [Nocardioides mangrovi]|uniref:mycothiol synthase n=1 Tax=Nocardioides mangrovi TaxID=2874580 RepID=UPI0027DEB99A|nr:mycothiol synthase [Nocardioides mangrovi]